MPPSRRPKKDGPSRGPGRPSKGIRSSYTRVEVWLPLDVREGLGRLADRRQQQTGEPTQRADVIREALEAYLREHLPDAKV